MSVAFAKAMSMLSYDSYFLIL